MAYSCSHESAVTCICFKFSLARSVVFVHCDWLVIDARRAFWIYKLTKHFIPHLFRNFSLGNLRGIDRNNHHLRWVDISHHCIASDWNMDHHLQQNKNYTS